MNSNFNNPQEKEKSKEIVEQIFREYFTSKLRHEDDLYIFRLASENAIRAMAEYTLATKANEGTNIHKTYLFGKNKPKDGGVTVSLDKISKDMWIPEKFKNILLCKKEDLEVFTFEEAKEFCNEETPDGFNHHKNNCNLVRRVIYAMDFLNQPLGKKEELIHSPLWRKDVFNYSKLLLTVMNESYNNLRNSKNCSLNERKTLGFEGIDLITRIYLSEMK